LAPNVCSGWKADIAVVSYRSMTCAKSFRTAGASLGFFWLASCHTPTATPREMRDVALQYVVSASNAADTNLVRYPSIADVIRRNPGCCALVDVADPEALVWNVKLIVRYRRQLSGPEPFGEQTFEFGPKLENIDWSARSLTPAMYRLLQTHRNGEHPID